MSGASCKEVAAQLHAIPGVEGNAASALARHVDKVMGLAPDLQASSPTPSAGFDFGGEHRRRRVRTVASSFQQHATFSGATQTE